MLTKEELDDLIWLINVFNYYIPGLGQLLNEMPSSERITEHLKYFSKRLPALFFEVSSKPSMRKLPENDKITSFDIMSKLEYQTTLLKHLINIVN